MTNIPQNSNKKEVNGSKNRDSAVNNGKYIPMALLHLTRSHYDALMTHNKNYAAKTEAGSGAAGKYILVGVNSVQARFIFHFKRE